MIVDDAALYTTFSRRILRSMADAGAEVLTYNSPWRYADGRWSTGTPSARWCATARLAIKRRYHEKFLVVDGTEAVLGGMNWGTKYALGGTDDRWWRDTDVHLTGPVVADVQRRFLQDLFVFRALRDRRAGAARSSGWTRRRSSSRHGPRRRPSWRREGGRYFPPLAPTGDADIRYVGHKPWDESGSRSPNAMLQLIRGAQRTHLLGLPRRPPAPDLRREPRRRRRARGRGAPDHELPAILSEPHGPRAARLDVLGVQQPLPLADRAGHPRPRVAEAGRVPLEEPGGRRRGGRRRVLQRRQRLGVPPHRERGVRLRRRVPARGPAAVRDRPRRLQGGARSSRRGGRCGGSTRCAAPLHERNLLVEPSLLPAAVARDLAAGEVTWKYADPPPGRGALDDGARRRRRRPGPASSATPNCDTYDLEEVAP